MRLLVVEDEKKVANFIRKGLAEEGYAVDLTHNGEEGLGMALDQVHDLIILDISLPKMDGIAMLKKLREENVKTPVLLLTVRATIEDKVLGLDAGADDYLTKPRSYAGGAKNRVDRQRICPPALLHGKSRACAQPRHDCRSCLELRLRHGYECHRRLRELLAEKS
jgi:CheY-like chemotaxis protein